MTGAINGINKTYTLSATPGSVNAFQLIFNGVTLERTEDYSLVGNVVTMVSAPIAGKLVGIYPDTAIGVSLALTRETTTTNAQN